jgi:cell division protein ZapE
VLSLDSLIDDLPPRKDGTSLLRGFVPPPRFAGESFATYRPDPRYPSQRAALEHLRAVAADLHGRSRGGLASALRSVLGQRARGEGLYLDGGFGVGKTHLLVALWSAAPPPKAYLSFDELVYTIGLLGVSQTRDVFRDYRLVAIDEWELDDPGNLKLALAFLRGVIADGVQVAVTSNTVPDELGRGRFSQKDFATEIEELSAAFETRRIEGEDFRHRRFEADPGREYFTTAAALMRRAEAVGERALLAPFDALLATLAEVHPVRYADLVSRLDALLITGVASITELPEALRWVHFVDKLYGAMVPLAASAEVPLGALFPPVFLHGPYAKKFGRCLSRMEELLGEGEAVDTRSVAVS